MTDDKRPRRQPQRLGESKPSNPRAARKTSPAKQQKPGDWFWVSLGTGIVAMVGILIFLLLSDGEAEIPETAVASEPTPTEPIEFAPNPADSGYSERAIADWVLSNGGRVRVLESGRPVYEVYDKTALPSGDFKLEAVSLDGIEATTDEKVGELWGLQTLAELGLSRTKITDAGVKTLPKLKSLNTLNLRGCPITDEGLATLGKMSDLKLLIADGGLSPMSTIPEDVAPAELQPSVPAFAFTDEGIASLAGLKGLQILALVSNKAGDAGLGSIAKSARKLVQLRTVGFGITNGGVSALKPLTNLRVLELSNSLIDDACIDTLSQLKWLEYLIVQGTKITPAGVKRLQQQLPKCKVFGGKFDPRLNTIREIFVLGGTVSITIDGQPPQQVTNFSDLPETTFVVQRIDLTGAKQVPLDQLTLPEATELVFRDSAVLLSDMAKMNESFPALTFLDLSRTQASDPAIEHLSKLKSLRSIDIRDARFTANGLVDLRLRLFDGCDVLDGEESDKTQDRRVAEAIVQLGGNVTLVEPGGKVTSVATVTNLPENQFWVRGVFFQ